MTRAQRRTLAVVLTAVAMVLLDLTIVNVALPAIRTDLDASFRGLQWVLDAYAVTLTATVLGAGALADLLGRRRLFAAGLALFTGASALCGAAPTVGVLLGARAVAGVGAALLLATSLAIVSHAFPDAHRHRAFAIWGVANGVAVSAGPVVGGVLVETLGWRAIFWVNVPVGAVALALAGRRLVESSDPAGGSVDWAGLIALTAGLGLLVAGLLEAPVRGLADPRVAGALIGAAVAGTVFVRAERRAARPLLDLRLLGQRRFGGLQAATLLTAVGFLAPFGLLAIYLQDVEGYSALASGLSLLPVNAVCALVAPLGGRLAARYPARLVITGGTALLALGLLLVGALAGTVAGWPGLAPGLTLMGVGAGLMGPAQAQAALAVAPSAQAGMAAGANNAFRQLGGALGVALLGVLMQAVVAARLGGSGEAARVAAGAVGSTAARDAFVAGLEATFLASGAAVVLAALVTWRALGGGGVRSPAARRRSPASDP